MGPRGAGLFVSGPVVGEELIQGTVRRTGGGEYRVSLEDGRMVEATLRGRLKLEDRTGDQVVVGDRVEVARSEEGAFTIEGVQARRGELVRRGRGGRRPKVLAANVDRMIVVVAARDPEPRTDHIDRLLAVGEASRLACVLVVNKLDLEGAEEVAGELEELYGSVGYPVIRTSALTGAGVDRLAEHLCEGTSVLTGPSGAGKSSLLNALEPGLRLRVGELSRKRPSGRHTTVRARLLRLECGGDVADTPGFSDVGLWGVAPEDLDRCFPELEALREACRFRGCTHTHEPECAVLAALKSGQIRPSRYETYGRLLQETREAAEQY